MPVLKPDPKAKALPVRKGGEKPPPKESYQRLKFKEWAYRRWGRYDLETKKGRLLIRLVGSTVGSAEVGWPDMDIFIRDPKGWKLLMLEWKRTPEHECTDTQLRRHAELRALGIHVFVVATQSEAQHRLWAEIEGTGTPSYYLGGKGP